MNSTFKKINLFMICSLAIFAGCRKATKFSEPQKLGGAWVPASTLNAGYVVYTNNCMQCHGMEGDGLGPASRGSLIPPRSFKQGSFKFSSVAEAELPTDEDLKRTIRYGLKGTPMLPWDLSDQELEAVTQYIKTFSDVWKKEKPGTPVATTPDPFGPERASEAIALGKKVFHGQAQCYSCHASYASLAEIDAAAKELTGAGVKDIRENPHLSVNADSTYGHKFMPPDFTKSPIKTGGDVASNYRLLGSGVNGTAMPAWKGKLSMKNDFEESERNQWALAYYVNYLSNLKYDDSARKAFFSDLNSRRANDPVTGAGNSNK